MAGRFRAAWDAFRGGVRTILPRNVMGGGWFPEAFGGTNSSAGVRVTSTTALGLSSWFDALRMISEDVGQLPLPVYRRRADGGRDLLPNDPIAALMNKAPNPDMTPMNFRQTLTMHALGWSGGYAEITRNNAGVPTGLFPLDPNTVNVVRRSSLSGDVQNLLSFDGALVYQVTSMGGNVFLPQTSVLHILGLGFTGMTSFSMAHLARDSIGSGLAQQDFAGGFFANGASPTGSFTIPKTITDEGFARLRKQFADRYQGPQNAHKPLILEDGMVWAPMSSDPEKAQMIESARFSVEDVARWFRIPAHKLGIMGNATFSNIEHQAIEYVRDTLFSWLIRWEQEVNRKLLRRGDRFVKHDVRELLRGDLAATSKYLSEQIRNGVFSVNDAREFVDMNRIEGEGGDTHFMQAQMIPIEQAIKEPVTPPALDPTQVKQLPEVDDEPIALLPAPPGDQVAALIESHAELIADGLRRCMRVREDRKNRGKTIDLAEHALYVQSAIGAAIESFCTLMGEVKGEASIPPMDRARALSSDWCAARDCTPEAFARGVLCLIVENWT